MSCELVRICVPIGYTTGTEKEKPVCNRTRTRDEFTRIRRFITGTDMQTTLTQTRETAQRIPPIHPLWLRITHWLNAFAALILMLSGWRIYDASPVFPGIVIPTSITLGGWLGGAL